MAYVSAINSTTRGLANAVNRFAAVNKEFAMDMFHDGLRGNANPTFVKELSKDIFAFDKNGKLNYESQKFVMKKIRELGLPENASWDEIFRAISLKRKVEESAIVKERAEMHRANKVPETPEGKNGIFYQA